MTEAFMSVTVGPPRTIAVVGGGQAAGWVLKTLRKEGFDGRLVMVADEIHAPYERPPLSKAVLSGDATVDSLTLVKPDEFEALKVECWQPDRAVEIDRDQHLLRTAQGRVLHFDRLIVATGGAARRLEGSQGATKNLAYLRTIDDAVSLSARLRDIKHLLVIGGGWIGLEVAATARKLGVNVTVVEGAPRLCARTVPPAVSTFLADLHRKQGVQLRIGTGLCSLEDHPDDSRRVLAKLEGGECIDADFAVAGIGLSPHTALVEAAGLPVQDGVVVDEYGATEDPTIFACGDVANHLNAWLGRRVRLESWANAQNQAIATAKASIGILAPYAEIPWFWSDQYDVNLQILGDVPVDSEPIVRGDLDAERASLFFLRDNMIRGVVAINAARDLKLARKWMNQGRKVDREVLMDVTVPLS
ncbi:FAD-dependent oxidoreductase [Caballeronia novacaledonica]|uniref:NAD(P)/FAD-dependent oxidoreductase n=1 Tax=Caballeronia novacaledonica TaxID=1544861 RepID=UPI001EE1E387|nr:FAD-dependent oxidoreductase [Caballeronia novacaledonica]GJH14809.1 FAD-dependent oxidoreductase [Caballeronia novacaledonica]